MIIADSFNLELLFSTHSIPIKYVDLDNSSNSVIDLMFLQSRSTQLNSHFIYSDLQLSLDHVPLSVLIAISDEDIVSYKHSIVKNSKEEISFINDVLCAIKSINISDLSDSNKLEKATISLTSRIEHAWKANLKQVKITKHSKSWWNEEYNCILSNYRTTRSLENW